MLGEGEACMCIRLYIGMKYCIVRILGTGEMLVKNAINSLMY